MTNVSLMILKSVKYDVQQDDILTGGIYRLTQANQWIMENYERLCNNQMTECEVIIVLTNILYITVLRYV